MAELDCGDTVYRYALYVGSFYVEEDGHRDRTSKVQRELEALRACKKSRPVTILISVKGIKVCSEDCSVVIMAHALRRISYATCDASYQQFAFLAREPLEEASHQYCHVFVTESSFQAEELNRIVGDAFQLAYALQLSAKQRQQLSQGPMKDTAAPPPPDSFALAGFALPRLCDRHCRQSRPPQFGQSSAGPSHAQRTILNVIELPPPPTTPPPPLTREDQSTQPVAASCSSQVSSQALESGHLSFGPPGEERPCRMPSPQPVCEPSFRKRAELRRPAETTSPGPGDSQVRGGSTRQPRRRQGLSWTHLFSSARHSAFIPETQKSPPNTPADVLDLLGSRKSPPPPVNICFDFNLSSGGSPVVALKERLDAEAVANAKASAFAEAAAVLAAAKQARAQSAMSSGSPDGSGKTESTDNSSSPCSTTSTHSEPSHLLGLSTNLEEAPPVPPLRLHSLRRPENHMQSHSTSPEHVVNGAPDSPAAPSSSPSTEQMYNNEVNKTLDLTEFSRASSNRTKPQPQRTRNADLTNFNNTTTRIGCNPGHSQRPVAPLAHSPNAANRSAVLRQTPRDSSQSQPLSAQSRRFSCALPASCQQWPNKDATQIQVLVHDHRFHRSSKADHESRVSSQSPLHVAVHRSSRPAGFNGPSCSGDAPQLTHSNGTHNATVYPDPGAMSTSTMSTETPTPTATPTPTQTPQPFNHSTENGRNHVVWGSSEDAEFLRQSPWYQAHLPREVAFELLAREELGSFIVRNSATHPDCCALSVRVPHEDNSTGITHYLIQRTSQGVRLKGLDKCWPSLKSLITHLTVIPEMLPCPLRLPQCISNPVYMQTDRLSEKNSPTPESPAGHTGKPVPRHDGMSQLLSPA